MYFDNYFFLYQEHECGVWNFVAVVYDGETIVSYFATPAPFSIELKISPANGQNNVQHSFIFLKSSVNAKSLSFSH